MDLSDNSISNLPANLSLLGHIEEFNLTNNPITNIEAITDALLSMGTNISKLTINLVEEDQVDYLLRTLGHLSNLNGIDVEREALFEEGESSQQEDSQQHQVLNEQSEDQMIDEDNEAGEMAEHQQYYENYGVERAIMSQHHESIQRLEHYIVENKEGSEGVSLQSQSNQKYG